MKKLMFIILSLVGLSACEKPQNCLHMHIGSVVMEYCGKDVACEEATENGSKIRICHLKDHSE